MKPLLAINDVVLDPMVPMELVALLGLLLGAGTIWGYRKLGQNLSGWQTWLLTTLRLLAVGLLLMVLLQPSRPESIDPPSRERVLLVGVDSSRSMLQADVGKETRFAKAQETLFEAELVPRTGVVTNGGTRLFHFAEDALPVTTSLLELKPEGKDTRFHRSVNGMANSLGPGQQGLALILLTDGHDFELQNPARTGMAARNRQIPIYAVAFGREGKVKDVAVRITGYQPYCYVKQKARVTASLRLIGCQFENIRIQLLRQGQVVQTKKITAGEQLEETVQFEVTEAEVGQYEYEVQVLPLSEEVDAKNNSAITYLNVIDQQIRVLVLEGEPYWDTTFLQRSLQRNDKVDLDSVIQYAPKKVRLIRKKPTTEELKVPVTLEDWGRYDVVVLGRSIEQLLEKKQVETLEQFVRERSGVVIFSRGKAFGGELAENALEPVVWGEALTEKVKLQIGREGRALPPFKVITEQGENSEAMPELLGTRSVTERKPLAASLATIEGKTGGDAMAGVIHRRLGQGQVLSIGVEGLWRWGFNAKMAASNTLFDRFWDQMVLWMMAGRDFVPNQQYSLRTSTANVMLGEKVNFRLVMRNLEGKVKEVPIRIFKDQKEVGRTSLAQADPSDPYRLTAEYLPEEAGRYRAVAQFPDGSTQESRFIVYQENYEETEVATDVDYLRRLCETSGGRLIKSEELGKLVAELVKEPEPGEAKTRLISLWDKAWFFYLMGVLFGTDWFLRRRWGLC